MDGINNGGSTPTAPSIPVTNAAEWHRLRRKVMIDKYGSSITELEKNSSSQYVGIPLLCITNLSLLLLSIYSGSQSLPTVFALSLFPGSMLSLWQLQILHDCLHGCLFDKKSTKVFGIPKSQLQSSTLFWGSMPSVFGYYLYLKFGHLSHHTNVGDISKNATLAHLFNSSVEEFEDGDILFVSHRMKLQGDVGPTFQLPFDTSITMSISRYLGFNNWIFENPIWNSIMFTVSFLFERYMLVLNDAVVAMSGRNYFFPNKPDSFHAAMHNVCPLCNCITTCSPNNVWI